ncbi:MAG: hypothetical protein AAF598_20975 [Bacteroidota bacterium]
MLKNTSTYDSPIFREFKSLDRDNQHEVVHFYEEHEKEIGQITFEEYFVCLVAYCTALYEIGAYRKLLRHADEVIEMSIVHNKQFVQGEDVYLKILLQKSIAFIRLHDYASAQRILTELVKLQPHRRMHRKLLRKCMYRQRPLYVKRLFAAGVFLYLLSVVMVVINILVIDPFYESWLNTAEYARFSVFIAGVIALVSGESYYHLSVKYKVRKLVRNAIRKQQKRLAEDRF